MRIVLRLKLQMGLSQMGCVFATNAIIGDAFGPITYFLAAKKTILLMQNRKDGLQVAIN
jgi:hypothetical protein